MFRDRPDRQADDTQYRIYRVPKKGKVGGILLSSRHVGAMTHYWGGRTVLCWKDECEACQAGNAPRWYGYGLLWSPKGQQIVIVEWTDKAHDNIDKYLTEHGTLRRAELHLERLGDRANGRLYSRIIEGPFAQAVLPAEVPLRPMLYQIWGISLVEQLAIETKEAQAAAIADAVIERAKRASMMPTNGKHNHD